MATFSLSATHQQESWLKYTITINGETSAGKIKITSIIGSHNYATGDVRDCTKSISHTLSFPGGSGTVTTFSGSSQSGVGTGWKCNNGSWTWGISGAPLEFSGSGTGHLQLTIASNGINHWPSNVTFDFGNITIPSPVTTPTLSAVTISNTTATGTSASFSVTNTGGASVTAQGCQFSATNFGTVVKSFTGTSGSVTGLSPNTTYYARAYATNSAGTGYSAVKSFTTLVGTPTLSAVSLSNVNSSGASASFTVTSTGGASITTSKIQASEAQTFSYVDDTINSTSGTFTRLFPGKLYYIRALASNGTNTGYSAGTTLGTAPTVAINPSSSSDGTIINLGTSTVGTISQWYYSLYDGSGNPLVQDATPGQTISGYTFGNNQVTGLTPGVKYGVSLRVTYTPSGATYSTTGTNSGIWYVTTSQPAAVSFSTNGAAFSPKPLYVSINGAAYKLITKDKLNIL